MTSKPQILTRLLVPAGLVVAAAYVVGPSVPGEAPSAVSPSALPTAQISALPSQTDPAPSAATPSENTPGSSPLAVETLPPRAIGVTPPFTADSPWNTPIDPDAAVDRNSERMIDLIDGRLSSNVDSYSYPVYYATPDTPRFQVEAARGWTVVVSHDDIFETETLEVPIPLEAKPSDGTDAQMIVIEPDTGVVYDLWVTRRTADGGWRVRNGSRYNINFDGAPPEYGSRGAGVPYIAGLIRPEEIEAGVIEHALAFAYDRPSDRFVFPANKSDGEDRDEFAMPEGARIQLDPEADEDDFTEWGLDRTGRIIARALQRYGMYLVDFSAANKIYAEDLTANVYRQREGWSWSKPQTLLGADTLAGIPVDRLRVLALPDGYWD